MYSQIFYNFQGTQAGRTETRGVVAGADPPVVGRGPLRYGKEGRCSGRGRVRRRSGTPGWGGRPRRGNRRVPRPSPVSGPTRTVIGEGTSSKWSIHLIVVCVVTAVIEFFASGKILSNTVVSVY